MAALKAYCRSELGHPEFGSRLCGRWFFQTPGTSAADVTSVLTTHLDDGERVEATTARASPSSEVRTAARKSSAGADARNRPFAARRRSAAPWVLCRQRG